MELIVEESNEKTERIDQFLTVYLKDISRSRLQSLIKDGHIKLNGKKTKPSQPISIGDSIQITIPPLRECAAKPERIDLDIPVSYTHLTLPTICSV